MSESKIDREMWLAEKDAFEAEADRRAALAKTRRKHLIQSLPVSIEDDPAHNVASAAEPLENQW